MSSENSLSFFGAGGHSHDGSNSTLIDVRRYSLFDFSLGYKGTQTRINSQATNQGAFEEYIVRIVNSKVLQPAGLDLAPDTLNGKAIRANTVTATEIKAGTITANELTSNVVLVNNIIRSSNFDGSFHANGVINSTGTTGWAVSYAGSSVFNSVTLRGRLTAGDIYIPNTTSPVFSVTSTGAMTATSASVTGTINATAGSISGRLTAGSVSIGLMNHYNSYYNGIDLTSNFTSCFIRGNGGEVYFRADNGSQWLKFENGTVYIKGTNFEVTNTSATFSGTLSGATGYVTGNFRVGEASIDGITRLKSQASTNDDTTYSFVAEKNNGENILTARADGYVGTPRIPNGTGDIVYISGGFLRRDASTIRVKENIEYYDKPIINFIKKLKPVTYTYKKDDHDNDFTYSLKQLDRNFGLIVEDIEEIKNEIDFNLINYESKDLGKFGDLKDRIPFSEESDFDDIQPRMYRVNSILSMCVKAIQELSDKIDELEARFSNE